MLIAILIIVAYTNFEINCESNIDNKTVIDYLEKYGYLGNNKNIQTRLPEDMQSILKNGLALFQEFYQLPGDGALNEITLQQMHKPRCGVADISHHSFEVVARKWVKTDLTWNFHLGDENVLKTTEAAFALWAANSSLTFTRKTLNPDILISFRATYHTYAGSRYLGSACSSPFDGIGRTLAHAFYPSGLPNAFTEAHIDQDEPWHIFLSDNPPEKSSLFYTLVHEIGHTLGLSHSTNNESIMFAYVPSKSIPIKLSLEDILDIQRLYGDNKKNFPGQKPATTTTTTTVATTMTSNEPEYMDLCNLKQIDTILILDHRIFIADRQNVWSVRINDRTFDKPGLLKDYMNFLPRNFTRLSAAYQRPSGDIVLFIDNMVYMVEYPTFKLLSNWPKTLMEIGIPHDAKINAAINTSKGRTYVIYNDIDVAEIDDCTMRASKYRELKSIFPGIPPTITSAFRHIDGNLYFINKRQFYKFNEFTKTVSTAGKFDLQIIDIECPRDGLLRQLQDLLNRLIRSSNIFQSKEDLMDEEREEE